LEFDNYDTSVQLNNSDTSVEQQLEEFKLLHEDYVPALLANKD